MSVVELDAPYYGRIEPEKILNAAKENDLDEVVVLGYKEAPEGRKLVVYASNGSAAEIVYMLECAKADIIT